MYLSRLVIENFRCFGENADRFDLTLKPGLTALVGENDAGKSAVIDALRFVLGTTDQEWYRLEDSDFHQEDTSREIKITCAFEGLSPGDQKTFLEYLTYGEDSQMPPSLYLNWTAKDTGEARKGRPYRRIELHCGRDGDGPSIITDVRELLRATYLRPLRDAADTLSAGRGSRLSQILHQTDQVKLSGVPYNPAGNVDCENLNILGIGDLANALLEKQKGIVETRSKIDAHLKWISLTGTDVKSSIHVSGSGAPESIRLRQLLEKLDLLLDGSGNLGLGSNNLLFMACELLLLGKRTEGRPVQANLVGGVVLGQLPAALAAGNYAPANDAAAGPNRGFYVWSQIYRPPGGGFLNQNQIAYPQTGDLAIMTVMQDQSQYVEGAIPPDPAAQSTIYRWKTAFNLPNPLTFIELWIQLFDGNGQDLMNWTAFRDARYNAVGAWHFEPMRDLPNMCVKSELVCPQHP